MYYISGLVHSILSVAACRKDKMVPTFQVTLSLLHRRSRGRLVRLVHKGYAGTCKLIYGKCINTNIFISFRSIYLRGVEPFFRN